MPSLNTSTIRSWIAGHYSLTILTLGVVSTTTLLLAIVAGFPKDCPGGCAIVNDAALIVVTSIALADGSIQAGFYYLAAVKRLVTPLVAYEVGSRIFMGIYLRHSVNGYLNAQAIIPFSAAAVIFTAGLILAAVKQSSDDIGDIVPPR